MANGNSAEALVGKAMFEPWEGPEYGDPGNVLGGRKLLIVGESHYPNRQFKDDVGTCEPGLTRWVVNEFCMSGVSNRFFDNLTAMVLGTTAGFERREAKISLFRAACFYNFVPVLVDPISRRPTEVMFQQGSEPFGLVKHRLKPSAVLVCGMETWRWMAPALPGIDDDARDYIFYDDGTAMHARVHHPSYAKIDIPRWQPRIERLLKLSEAKRQLGWKQVWGQPEPTEVD